ncbi:MAG: hypothetical protein U5N56_08200 [Candidatus Marinimicrobia bacterium]|nr:hypothetical protein [Candidatus Neomarinimicrobiota bacterium]
MISGDWNKEVIGDDPNRLTPFVELSLKKEAADVTEKTIKEPEVEPLKKDASVVIAITVDKPEVKPLKKDTVYVVEKAIEAPEVEPLKKDTADVVEKATEKPEVEPLKKDTADVAEKAIEKPEVEPLKKDTADVAEKAIEKPEVEPLKKDTADVAEKATEKPEVKTLKEDIKSYSWKFKLYGSYGMVEPLGVTGQLGWNGNLGGFGATALFDNMYTWEVGLMLHPYGFTGREAQCPNSFGISIDYASFDHVGAVDTTISNFNANDTTATRYAISFVLQQNLTGRKEARPKLAIYFEESLRVGIHSFGSIDGDLYGNNHISGGIGLAQGINFLIFDLKFYETLAYSPDIARITGLSFFESLDFEVGLRLGIALKL